MIDLIEIALLITCHNRKEKTLSCLTSLFNVKLNNEYRVDVFLVDDGSTDGTAEAVKKEFPNVSIIQGNGNLYWNNGMHLAWEVASQKKIYEYFVWLNDDVFLKTSSFKDLISASILKPGSIICGTMQSKYHDKPTYGGRDRNGNLLIPNGKPQSCHLMNGNLVLIPNLVFQLIGNLDPIFPHSMGDFDYVLRARKKGIQCFVSAEYSGFCENNQSLPKWCLPEVPFFSRIKNLYSPLGRSHPYYYFIFDFRHNGFLTAVLHFFTIHLRVFSPKLYIALKNK
jgi:GT2 family glycosyltransferase